MPLGAFYNPRFSCKKYVYTEKIKKTEDVGDSIHKNSGLFIAHHQTK